MSKVLFGFTHAPTHVHTYGTAFMQLIIIIIIIIIIITIIIIKRMMIQIFAKACSTYTQKRFHYSTWPLKGGTPTVVKQSSYLPTIKSIKTMVRRILKSSRV